MNEQLRRLQSVEESSYRNKLYQLFAVQMLLKELIRDDDEKQKNLLLIF